MRQTAIPKTARRQTRASLLRALAILTMAVVLSWSAGFTLFAWRALQPAGPPPQADGIVVLTGGAGRIEAALSLLSRHRARLLLISGVQPKLDLAALMRAAGQNLPVDSDFAARIALGHVATSTLGNAIETAEWAHAHRLVRLIVVTAGYHMPRALAEIGAALPDATLLPYPVRPPAMRRLRSFGTLRLLVAEYDKWLLVAAGLSGGAHPAALLGEIA